jgi:hypothetical protein
MRRTMRNALLCVTASAQRVWQRRHAFGSRLTVPGVGVLCGPQGESAAVHQRDMYNGLQECDLVT